MSSEAYWETDNKPFPHAAEPKPHDLARTQVLCPTNPGELAPSGHIGSTASTSASHPRKGGVASRDQLSLHGLAAGVLLRAQGQRVSPTTRVRFQKAQKESRATPSASTSAAACSPCTVINFWTSAMGSCAADLGLGPRIPALGARRLPALLRGPLADKRLHCACTRAYCLRRGSLRGVRGYSAAEPRPGGAPEAARLCCRPRRGQQRQTYAKSLPWSTLWGPPCRLWRCHAPPSRSVSTDGPSHRAPPGGARAHCRCSSRQPAGLQPPLPALERLHLLQTRGLSLIPRALSVSCNCSAPGTSRTRANPMPSGSRPTPGLAFGLHPLPLLLPEPRGGQGHALCLGPHSLALSRLQPLGTAAVPRREVRAYRRGRCRAAVQAPRRYGGTACRVRRIRGSSRDSGVGGGAWRGCIQAALGGSVSCPGQLSSPGADKPYFGAPLHNRFCYLILSNPYLVS